MQKINLETYPRRALYEAFKDRDIPFYSVTVAVDITEFKRFVDEHKTGFFISLSYLISRAVNRVTELRHRIIDGELYEFERVDPGYTILLDDKTFSFCDSRHFEDFEAYRIHAEAKIQEARECPDRATGDKHHMFFISNIPWFGFTSITHPFDRKYASIPVIATGKYGEQSGRLILPVGIQVHHGLVDGIHLGEFYEHLSEMCRTPAEYLR